MVVGGGEIAAGILLLFRRWRFVGAVIFLFILTGAITTHIINHDVLMDCWAAPTYWLFSFVIALGSWPSDWREPLRWRRSAQTVQS